MARYQCSVCGHVYDEQKEGEVWTSLPESWACPVCDSAKPYFAAMAAAGGETSASEEPQPAVGEYLAAWRRPSDDLETHMADIHEMAATGRSIVEPMRTRKRSVSWDDLLIKGAQIAKVPLNEDEAVNTRTVIGPGADEPLIIDTPIYITHMSMGALSREAKLALARGSAAVRTAMCSGEGGILRESMQAAYKYILEYVPNRYSITDENLKSVAAVEIKLGQSAKPGMGGHLPGSKVTEEIAAIRGFPKGSDIISPARFDDIRNRDDLSRKVEWLREKTAGKPIGVKIAAGNIEADLAAVLHARPDFITLDGRAGATGAAPKFVKDTTSIPSIFALCRARRFLDERGADNVSLVITGGLRISPDFAKALALGADAVAIGTAALMACGCQQYRICNTGKCPVGVTSQDPQLRARLDVDQSAKRLESFLRVSTEELTGFARLTGNDDVHKLAMEDLCTTNSEISQHTAVEHA
ncbi:MAG: rubredoxin [Candidatus Nealsonbacteria bacterium]|nr:rubredoxin [Candidatus Nealsonbacteria bacterium]